MRMQPTSLRYLPLLLIAACSGGSNSTDQVRSFASTASELKAIYVEESSVTLLWTDTAVNEDRYVMERSTTGEASSFSILASLDANSTSFSDSNIERGHYFYRVRAESEIGVSDYSNVADVETFLVSPLNVNVEFQTPVSLKLTWADGSSREDGFVIERAIDDGSFTERTRVAQDIEQFIDTDCNNDHIYRFRVRAFDSEHISSFSSEAEINTALNPPDNLTASFSPLPLRVTLQWNNGSPNAAQLEVQRMLEPSGPFQFLGFILPTPTNYVDSSIEVNKSYRYRIRAGNANGTSSFSSQILVDTTIVPNPPVFLAARSVEGKVTLTWEDVSTNEVGFKIERAGATGDFSELAAVDADVRTFVDPASLGPVFRYRVSAYNSAGSSSFTNIAQIDTGLVPSKPSGLSATRLAGQGVFLQWTDNSNNETGFIVEKASLPCSSYSVIKNLAANVTQVLDAPDPGSLIFCYKVKANNSAVGESEAASATINSTVLAPSNLQGQLDNPYSKITLTWTDNSSNETYFIVERATRIGWTLTPWIELGRPTTVGWIDQFELATNVVYHHRVRACNAIECSPVSFPAITYTSFNDVNFGLSASFSKIRLSDGIRLTWLDHFTNPSETRWVIRRFKGNPDTLDREYYVGLNATSITDDIDLQEGVTYYYQIAAGCPIGLSNISLPVQINTTLLPAAPTNLQAQYNASLGGVFLSWNDNSNNEQSFLLYAKECNGNTCGSNNVVATLGANTTFYLHQHAPGDANFGIIYTVAAKNAAGETLSNVTPKIPVH